MEVGCHAEGTADAYGATTATAGLVALGKVGRRRGRGGGRCSGVGGGFAGPERMSKAKTFSRKKKENDS